MKPPRTTVATRLPRLQIGDSIGVLECVGVESRDVNGSAKWVMHCTECGMRCVRSQSTVNRWRRGAYTAPTTCEMAHDDKGNPTREGGEYKGKRGPQTEDRKRERAIAAVARDTRPQRICVQCCGLPDRRPRKGQCKCGGWYAEERRPRAVGIVGSALMTECARNYG